MKFDVLTDEEAERGRQAVQGMSEKAQRGYAGAVPITVWEYDGDTDDGATETLYAYDFGGWRAKSLKREWIEMFLEDLADSRKWSRGANWPRGKKPRSAWNGSAFADSAWRSAADGINDTSRVDDRR